MTFVWKKGSIFIMEHENRTLVTGTEIKMRVYSQNKNE